MRCSGTMASDAVFLAGSEVTPLAVIIIIAASEGLMPISWFATPSKIRTARLREMCDSVLYCRALPSSSLVTARRRRNTSGWLHECDGL